MLWWVFLSSAIFAAHASLPPALEALALQSFQVVLNDTAPLLQFPKLGSVTIKVSDSRPELGLISSSPIQPCYPLQTYQYNVPTRR